MAITFAAWNTESRLSRRACGRRGTPQHILAGIARLDADVIVLTEAYYKDPAPGADDELHRLGYWWQDARYEDVVVGVDDDDRSNVHLRILSRLPLENVRQVRFNDVRTLLCATVCDPVSKRKLLVVATHLDDRAETLRLGQARAIAAFITNEKLPTVMLGDFNAVWDGWGARLMRSGAARYVARHIPHRWLMKVATRFVDMASGTTLRYLATHAGLRDADSRRQATATPKLYGAEWLPSIRLAQLDHILISDDISASPVRVMPDGGSDHRAIISTIRVRG